MYFWATFLFVFLTLGLAGLGLYGLSYALRNTHWPQAQQNRIWRQTAWGLAGWLLFSAILAWSGFLLRFDALPPRFLVVFLPPLAGALYLATSRRTIELIQQIPPHWLVAIQSFRILMELILLMLFLDGILPVQMTFEGRNGDILTGLTAPFIAYFGLYKNRDRRWVALLWNGAGMLLLINIVAIALLSTPAPFRVFMNEPANTLIAYAPYVWLPGFVVPVAYTAHFLSIRQLLQSQTQRKPIVVG